jgi:acetolactate synthase-1/2/3 large subunit
MGHSVIVVHAHAPNLRRISFKGVTNAFRSAECDRPGAAFVSLPMDIVMAPAKCDVLTPPAYSAAGPADSAAIKEAARLINQAKKPVVLLGMLASKPENAAAVQELIDSGKLPVVGTFQAAGAISVNLFNNFGGRVGQINNQPADEILATGDLVISIGYDPVEYWPSIWNKSNKRPIVHLDALLADVDNSYSPTVELIGNIAATIRLLTPLVSHPIPDSSIKALLGKIAEDRQELARSSAALNGTPVHPLRLVSELQNILTPDTTLCLDMGSFHLWLARHLYSFRARQVLISNGQQTLGVALPWAIAATLVRPSEMVLSISGDGTYDMVAVQEDQK